MNGFLVMVPANWIIPLIGMDPDDYGRFNNDVMLFWPSIFPMVVAVSTARKNAAGGCEQGGNAYVQDDVFHIYSCFVISSEDSS